jgi:ankyrin repeat protein
MTINSDIDQYLIDACWDLNIEEVRLAIEKGANVNAVREYGYFPLLACVDDKNRENSKQIIEILDLLLEKGAHIDFYLDDKETVLIYSSWLLRSYEVVEFLLNKGANPNILNDGETALDLTYRELAFTGTFEDKPDEVEALNKIYDLLEKFGGKFNEDLKI